MSQRVALELNQDAQSQTGMYSGCAESERQPVVVSQDALITSKQQG